MSCHGRLYTAMCLRPLVACSADAPWDLSGLLKGTRLGMTAAHGWPRQHRHRLPKRLKLLQCSVYQFWYH